MSLAWGRLISTTEQHGKNLSSLDEVHPIAGSMIDSHLRNALANRSDVAGIVHRQTIDAHLNTRPSANIAQPSNPTVEGCAFDDFDHV